MTFADFLNKTATVRRLGTADRTQRSFETVGTIDVHVQSAGDEVSNTIEGQYTQKYKIYAAVDADVQDGDHLIVEFKTYKILRVTAWSFRGIHFKKCICELGQK